MSFKAIAGDHHQGVRNHLVEHLLRVTEYKHEVRRAGTIQRIESIFGEVLPGFRKHEVAIVDAHSFLPARVEDC